MNIQLIIIIYAKDLIIRGILVRSSYILTNRKNLPTLEYSLQKLENTECEIYELNSYFSICILQNTKPIKEKIFYADKGNLICLIGQIYNRLELYNLLMSFDALAINYNDAELFFKLYLHFKKYVTQIIDGAFTAFITTQEQCLIFTNSTPTFPLYYYNHPGNFWITNEVKLLINVSTIHTKLKPVTEINPKKIYTEDFTIFEYIKKVPKNHLMKCTPNHISDKVRVKIIPCRKYFIEESINIPQLELKDKLHYLFNNIIQNYCEKTSNIGIALSGGIDSSLVATYHKRLFPENTLYSFTIGSEKINEFHYANTCAHHVNSIHRNIVFDETMFLEGLLNLIYFNEMFDSYLIEVHAIMDHIYKLCANSTQIMLTGFNADNLFGANISPDLPLEIVNKVLLNKNCRPSWTGEYNPYLSYKYGLSTRSPYLSNKFFSLMYRIDAKIKIYEQNLKYPLKLLASDYELLPQENIWRKKQNLERGAANDLIFSEFLKKENSVSYTSKTLFCYEVFRLIFEKKIPYYNLDLYEVRKSLLGY